MQSLRLMHCQTETASVMRERNANYVLQVKNNQKKLKLEIEAYLYKTRRDPPELIEANSYLEVDGEHGRINERRYTQLSITDWFDETEKFKDSFAIIEVECTRTFKDKVENETSYYITSLNEDAESVAGYIRRHWAIENSQHWVLDVTFREDECQIYAKDGARNLASVRRLLLNMIKDHPKKDSVAGKMQRACWDENFRSEILFGKNMAKI
ncbi:MAG: ISAs1 family transposase [Psychromonas sp.]|nr:ISAs1 family transposase [Psychromonas sp.]